jgi:tRNA(Ile)-lysidine synthase
MGSSPVTATIQVQSMEILGALEAFFRNEAPLGPGDCVVAAFSGGPDSTALLWGVSRLAARHGFRALAAHLDHATDGGSAGRAAAAARLAARLGVPFVTERRAVPALRLPGESPESAGRRERYAFLERVRREAGARWIATAHHRDDQAETVLLRLSYGSGLEGLAGIRPVHGAVVRPLLGLSRADLRAAVEAAGLTPLADPTNDDLGLPRNRLRHRLLPALEAAEPGLPERLARLAGRARAAGGALERRLERALSAPPVAGGVALGRGEFEKLPEPVRPFVLAALHRRAGAPYPAGAAARAELLRQLGGRGRAGCDCGGGWRWEAAAGDLLVLRRRREGERVPDFTYTLQIPGSLDIPELALRVEVSRRPVAAWMFRGSPRRAGLALPVAEGDRVTVRNRRPGDRLHPLGAGGSRRLKCVLVDRRVPRHQRERLPLLCVGERIAWVPGVTIDERFRLRAGETTAWVAEVTTR